MFVLLSLTNNVPVVYGAGRNDFDAGNIHYKAIARGENLDFFWP
jgi:hypothetical protein